MIIQARAYVLAIALGALAKAAEASRAPVTPRASPAIITTFRGVLKGPAITPGPGVQLDEGDRMRTRELDDIVTLRLRLTIPF